MKLGKLQKMWIASLREHPERQYRWRLGKGTPEDYQACCLGELHLCAYRMKGEELPFYDGVVRDGDRVDQLGASYRKYGLRSQGGVLSVSVYLPGYTTMFYSLAAMNDNGVTWAEIADFVEANPELVFTKSV